MHPQTTFKSLVVSGALAFCPTAEAEFGASKRSINGTGETLAEGEYQAGIGELAYGVRSDLMVKVPTLSLLVGYGRAEARYKSRLTDSVRLAPYLFVETPRHAGLGSDIGVDFGAAKEHSVTIGARVRHGPIKQLEVKQRPVIKHRTLVRPNAEYDYYHAGNVAYVGMQDYVFYGGYTWAWETFHVGLITSPIARFVPLPYVYWRF